MSTTHQPIEARLASVRTRVEAAARRAGRDPRTITLIGVSKRQPVADVMTACAAGLEDIGENYVQEAIKKIHSLRAGSPRPPRFHFIGQLQRNKTKHVAEQFDVVQTVDRESLGSALDKRAAAAHRTLDILLQVDVSQEPQKGGIAPQDLPGLIEASQRWSALRVTGLMTLPASADSAERTRPAFRTLRDLRDAAQRVPGGERIHELSMGMSRDFEVAIEEGATIIRVGTEIFGARDPGGTA